MVRLSANFLPVLVLGAFCVSAQNPTPSSGPPTTNKSSSTPGSGWSNNKKEKGRDPNVRDVTGVVRSAEDTPLEGAVVKLKNNKTLQIRSYITQKDGKYQFYGLSTNVDYEIVGEFSGMMSKPRTLSVFDGRQDAIVNLKLDQKKPSKEKSTTETAEAKSGSGTKQ